MYAESDARFARNFHLFVGYNMQSYFVWNNSIVKILVTIVIMIIGAVFTVMIWNTYCNLQQNSNF